VAEPVNLDELPELELYAPDFGAFFTQACIVMLLTRIHLVYCVAVNDTFAARVFKAYSATAKVKVIGQLASADVVEVS
jgi:peroxiredoxin